MKKFIIFVFIAALSVLNFHTQELICPFSKIDQAVENNELSIYDSAVLKAKYIIKRQELPEAYIVPNASIKSITPYMMEILSIMDNAPDYYKAKYKVEYWRPELSGEPEIYISPEYNFYIHYTRTGFDAVNPTDNNNSGIPDFVEATAEAADYVYDLYHHRYNYLPPPGDGELGGGFDNYDIYIWGENIAGAIIGDQSHDMQEFPMRTWSSFVISVHSSLSYVLPLVAHEYAHGVQLGYLLNYNASSMSFYESHAEYLTGAAYPDQHPIIDGFFVDFRLRRPYLCLWRGYQSVFPQDYSYIPYGTVIWPVFLYEFISGFDHDMLTALTERKGLHASSLHTPVYSISLSEIIDEWSDGAYCLASAYNVYTNWNYLVSENYDQTGYTLGAYFANTPNIHHEINASSDIPFYGTGDPAHESDYWVESMGSHYNIIHNPDQLDHNAIQIDFQGLPSPNASWGYSILKHRKNYPLTHGWSIHSMKQLKLSPFTDSARIYNINDYDRIVFIVDNTRDNEKPEISNYEYWISFVEDGPNASISESNVYFDPNNFQTGDLVNIHANIKNIGTEPIDSAVVNFYTSYQQDTDLHLIGSIDIENIGPGDDKPVFIPWSVQADKNFPGYVIIEVNNIMPSDIDFSNNTVSVKTAGTFDLDYFSAMGLKDKAYIRWKTLSETNIQGFNLYRVNAVRTSPFMSSVPILLNDQLIQGPDASSVYTFIDTVIPQGNFVYIIEAVSEFAPPYRSQTRLFWY